MKFIITTLVFFSSIVYSIAQDGVTTFGLRVGILSPALYGSEVSSISNAGSPSPKTGFTGGILINSRLKKYFWLKHELLFSSRVLNVQLKDSIHSAYNSIYSRQYIDIFPLSPCFHFKGLQIYGGPYLGLLCGAWMQRMDAGGNLQKNYSIYGSGTEMGKQQTKYDAGIMLGIEYEFRFGLNISAKYVRGFTSIIDYANANTFDDPHGTISVYNSYLSLNMGYSFIKKAK